MTAFPQVTRGMMVVSGVALLAAFGILLAAPACAVTVRCDGVGDAAAALNRAVAPGGKVQIGPGTCMMSGSLMLPSGVTLSGAGIGKTILRALQGGAFNVIQIGGGTPASGSTDVDVSGLTVDGAANAGGKVAHESDGVLVPHGSSNVRVHDMEVENAADNGIDVSGSHVDVTDNLVHDNWHNGIYVIGRGGKNGPGPVRAEYVRILRNRVSDNSRAAPLGTAAKTFDGIDLDPRHANCLVAGNILEDNDIILLDHGDVPSGPDQVSNNTITDPRLTVVNGAGGDGIDVADNIDGFRITGNRIQGVVHFGIIVGGRSRNGLISGNVIRGTTAEGILLRSRFVPGESHNIEISDNAVWPGPRANGRAAIAVRHMAGVRVVGNNLATPTGETGQPGRLDVATAGPGLVVENNR